MTDKKTYLLEKPIPEHGVLVRELVALVGVGLVVEELQRRQERDGKITNLLDLACVAFEAPTTRDALHRLVEIVYRLAREISAPELRDGALALVGVPGSRAGGITRRRAQAAAVVGKDVGEWERRDRKDIFDALAQALRQEEERYRESTAADHMIHGGDVPPQLAINWLDRLERYRGMAEQLDSLHSDIASFDMHRAGETPLSEGQLKNLYVSSLYRLAYFEHEFHRFEHERRGLWLFSDVETTEQVENDLWQLRLLTRYPEHRLAWLALAVQAEPFLNLWSFRQRIESEEEGQLALGRWQQVFNLCDCDPSQPKADCPLHGIATRCERFLQIERKQRDEILGWYRRAEELAEPLHAQKRATLTDVHVRTRGRDLPPVSP